MRRSLHRYRRPAGFVARCALFALLAALFLEVTFRTVLPATQHPRSRQDPADKIFRFDPDWLASGVRTFGPFCRTQGRWRINDEGWNSVYDYAPRHGDEHPRIAIVGDSYIAGFAVDVDRHVDVRLRELLGGDVDVYAFGAPGASLAQIVGISGYVADKFAPDICLVFVSNGAVEKSIGHASPHWFGVRKGPDGFVFEEPNWIYRPSRLGSLAYRSALVRYITMNRHVGMQGTQEVMGMAELRERATADLDPDEVGLAKFLLGELRSRNPRGRVIVFSDVLRNLVYEGTGIPPMTFEGRLLAEAAATVHGIEFMDMTVAFQSDFQLNGLRFETPPDPHWNARGHEVAAAAIAAYLKAPFPGPPPAGRQ